MSCSTKAAVEIQENSPGNAAGRDAEMGDEAAVAPGSGDRSAAIEQQRHRLRRALPQRLRQQQPDHAPAPPRRTETAATKFERQPNSGLQHAAEQRRHDRRQRHDRRHARQLAGDAGALVHVAHHGARQHHRARPAERLQEARRDQQLDRGRERAGKRRQRRRSPSADQQHRPAAMPVGQRPEEHLREGEADQIDRDRELHLRGRRVAAAARCPAATPDTCRPTAARCPVSMASSSVSAKEPGRSIRRVRAISRRAGCGQRRRRLRQAVAVQVGAVHVEPGLGAVGVGADAGSPAARTAASGSSRPDAPPRARRDSRARTAARGSAARSRTARRWSSTSPSGSTGRAPRCA